MFRGCLVSVFFSLVVVSVWRGIFLGYRVLGRDGVFFCFWSFLY